MEAAYDGRRIMGIELHRHSVMTARLARVRLRELAALADRYRTTSGWHRPRQCAACPATEPCPSPTGSHKGTVGVHGPRRGRASLSLSSGHGGIVTATILSGSPVSSLARNWNVVPRGMVRHIPGASSTVVGSSPSCCRHMHPAPPMMYQISWTVRWQTAVEVSPASSWKCAKLPWPVIRHRGRTVDPSGAVTSGAFSSVRVSGESCMTPPCLTQLAHIAGRGSRAVQNVPAGARQPGPAAACGPGPAGEAVGSALSAVPGAGSPGWRSAPAPAPIR